jgi:hypothetical protein
MSSVMTVLAVAAALVSVASASAVKLKRESEELGNHTLGGDEGDAADGSGGGSFPVGFGGGGAVSLGEILGLLFLICCVLYCIGIAYKIVRICKGTYVESEPVFLKYK